MVKLNAFIRANNLAISFPLFLQALTFKPFCVFVFVWANILPYHYFLHFSTFPCVSLYSCMSQYYFNLAISLVFALFNLSMCEWAVCLYSCLSQYYFNLAISLVFALFNLSMCEWAVCLYSCISLHLHSTWELLELL